MVSWILILITGLITISFGYASEEYEENYFKIERLSFNRSTNQLAYDEIPIQLAPSLETDLKRYKSGKLKIFLATQKRPIPDNILNNFINQTVIDWCAENLKDLREESECEPNYINANYG